MRDQDKIQRNILPIIGKGSTAPAYAGEVHRFSLGVFKDNARFCRVSFLVPMIMLMMAAAAHAQLTGLHVKGDAGLDSGTQAPPGAYYGSVVYNYDSSRINNQFGTQVNTTGNINLWAGLGLINVVTQKKFLGGNYGFMEIPASGLNTALELPRLSKGTGAGFGDTYIQPVSFGRHASRADVSPDSPSTFPQGGIRRATQTWTIRASACGDSNLPSARPST